MKNTTEPKNQLNELESQIDQKEKELQKSKDNYETTEEWKNLQLRQKEINRKLDKLRKEQDKIEIKISAIFLDGELTQPYYSRGDSNYSRISTNINYETLKIIQRHLKIRLLKASHIEDLVRKLIQKERLSDKRLQEVGSKIEELNNEEREIWTKEKGLQKGDSEIFKELWELRQERDLIKFTIENPVKQKQYNERDSEREKVTNQEIINKILEELKGVLE